ncbi:Dph6-related ATP pyrophosphatase [Proteocatella sphenisci]|uniref:Dph6-related ATP pyrophosphatase n=1 Tax=Proteocatella sphenisci TaxID=181070 RepID=UPI000491350F|nr:diphthine--ammonia ligase [Proteocatella sphenisci]
MRMLASFSGGKDSVLSLDRALEQGHEIAGLFVTVDIDGSSWFHDINHDILEAVSMNLAIPVFFCPCRQGDDYTLDYEKSMRQMIAITRAQACIFGDIDIESHRQWAEERAQNLGIEAVFPLWQENRRKLVSEFVDKGYKAAIKKVNKKYLDSKYLGRVLDHELIEEFEMMGIDSCGENGEYHTLVYDGPIFSKGINLRLGKILENEYCYSREIELA